MSHRCAICRQYNARLAKIPPPLAVSNPEAMAQAIEQALPIVFSPSAATHETLHAPSD